MPVAETFTCACDGYTEFGWTIKESHNHDDTLFDIVIGTVSYETAVEEATERMERGWDATRKAAEAFAAEAPEVPV